MYQHLMRMMPPFKGSPMKGPQFEGSQHHGAVFKGPPVNSHVKANQWRQSKGPANSLNSHPVYRFGLPRFFSYPETSFENYPTEPESVPEHPVPHLPVINQEQEHEHNQDPEEIIPEEILAPPPPDGEITGSSNIFSSPDEVFY